MLKKYLSMGHTTISNLMIDYYQELGMTNEEFLLWLQLTRFEQKGERFPNLERLAKRLNWTTNQLYNQLNLLIEKQMMQIIQHTDEQGKKTDVYDFSPLYSKIEQFLTQKEQKQLSQNKQQKAQTLFRHFEEEFGRPLSPIEYQRINQWIDEDHYQTEIIYLALQEAVINQVYSLNYIDRILLSWERKNIRTPQQVSEEQKNRKQRYTENKSIPTTTKTLPKIPLHNWLDEN